MTTSDAPTPWTYEDDNDVGPNDESFWEFYRLLDANGAKVGEVGEDAHAALIVHAVNAHDALLEAVQRLGRLAGMMADPTIDCTEIDWTKALVDAETAIAEATGEPQISR